jgi:hypothetical protein
MNTIQEDEYEVINFFARSLKFKCNVFQMFLTIQSSLSLKAVKKIILLKTDFKETWIKFNLNEALFTDKSKVFELQYNVDTINLILFIIKNQLTTFKYSDSEFRLILINNKNIGVIEAEIKYKAGIRNDVSFYGFGNRRILKGKMVYKHQIITLK